MVEGCPKKFLSYFSMMRHVAFKHYPDKTARLMKVEPLKDWELLGIEEIDIKEEKLDEMVMDEKEEKVQIEDPVGNNTTEKQDADHEHSTEKENLASEEKPDKDDQENIKEMTDVMDEIEMTLVPDDEIDN